jgi:UrcA family protein
MTKYSDLLRRGLVATIALAAMLPLVPAAQAHDISRTIPISDQTVGQSRTGTPIVRVGVEKMVDYSDLDLRNSKDVKVLNRRIAIAADQECQGMAFSDPIGRPGAYTCTKNAIAEARSQVQEAIASATSR